MWRKSAKNSYVVVVTLFWFAVSFAIVAEVSAQSWLAPEWSYRMQIVVRNSSSSNTLTNYQVKVSLRRNNFHFSDARSGGQDLRFTADDGTTALNYWIEYFSAAAESAVVWVKIPHVAAADSAVIFMYYGNPLGSSSSSGNATFEFFDDFESGFGLRTGWSVKAQLPSPTADAAAATFGNQLYVFGGYDRNPTTCDKYYLNETFSYNPTTNTWARLADMPTPRWGLVAVEFNGLIHVFAGEAQSGFTSVHEIYDPVRNLWESSTNVPSGLAYDGGMGVRYGDKIHLFNKQYHYEYDPVTHIYTPKANVPTPRTWGTCAVVDGLIYIIGGYSYGSPSGATNVTEVYNPVTDSWTAGTPMPVRKYGVPRENPVIGKDIYVTYGLDGGFHADNYVYHTSTNTWERMSSGINPRDGVGCGVINGKLYLAGGRDLFSCAVGTNHVEEYDPAADKGGDPWVISDSSVIKRDTLARSEGLYGLLFDKQTTTGEESAQHYQNLQMCAVDINWNVTDFRGIATVQPQAVIQLTDDPARGSLYYYNNGGRPDFRWYNGSFTSLQDGVWNQWYPVTIIWNAANSRVSIAGREYTVPAAAVNSNTLYLRANKQTRQYLDLVRVRKYASPEPTVILGTAQTSNHPPALALRDSSFSECVRETTCIDLVASDPDSPEILTVEKISGPGYFATVTGPPPLHTHHCFFPAPSDSVYLFVFKATDSKGAFAQESSYVHVHLNREPKLTLRANLDTLLCNPGDSIYLSISAEDPDAGDTLSLEKISSTGILQPANPTRGPSRLSANFLWKPVQSDTSGGPHSIVFRLRDLCGSEIWDTLFIDVKFNHPPIFSLPPDTTYTLCMVNTICLDHIFALDPDLGDSVSVQKISGAGFYNPSTRACCFTPSSKDSTYTFVFQATDRCKSVTLGTLHVSTHLNQAPWFTLPADTSYKLRYLGDSILFKISASDQDKGDSLVLTKISTEGELRPSNPIRGIDSLSGNFFWRPAYADTLFNPHLLIFQVTDKCGHIVADTVQIRIQFNHPPLLTSQDSSYSLCQDSTVCFDHLIGSDSDPDDSLRLALVSGPSCLFLTTMIRPNLLTGFACFHTSGTDSTYTFIFELKDRCGAVDRDTVHIRVRPPANLITGDPNGDMFVTVSDVVYLINYLFKGGQPPVHCPKSGDVNCDGKVTVSDAVYLINYLFKGGSAPCR
jgi:hypothetical protein